MICCDDMSVLSDEYHSCGFDAGVLQVVDFIEKLLQINNTARANNRLDSKEHTSWNVMRYKQNSIMKNRVTSIATAVVSNAVCVFS